MTQKNFYSSVIVTYAPPRFITGVSLFNNNKLNEAAQVKFYYRTGKDVIVLMEVGSYIEVYIPSFSSVSKASTTSIVRECEEHIIDEVQKKGIKQGTLFLFDTVTKEIVDDSQFYDYFPIWNIAQAIFKTVDGSGVFSNELNYLTNTTSVGCVVAAALLYAKRNLLETAERWTTPGKQLLSYLVAKENHMTHEFNSDRGQWDNVEFDFSRRESGPTLDITKLNTSRLYELLSVKSEPQVNESENVKGMGKISLSSMVEIGVDNVVDSCLFKYHTILVQIDMMNDMFSSIEIDVPTGKVFVKLNPGVSITDAELIENMGTDDLIIDRGKVEYDEDDLDSKFMEMYGM